MKLTPLDFVVEEPFAPNKPHADMVALGYKFQCAHISLEAFIESNTEIEYAHGQRVVAVRQECGVNIYIK